MTERKIYRVTVETECYVLAEGPLEAAAWAEANMDNLRGEVQDSYAVPAKLKDVTEEERGALPWVAGDLSDDEDELTVEQWLQKTGDGV